MADFLQFGQTGQSGGGRIRLLRAPPAIRLYRKLPFKV